MIYIICGQTATGKSDLAVQLALENNGEIISADSRQVYRGLDVGSNKITDSEMRGIPHWGLDIIEPGERFNVAQFQTYAREKVSDILSRGKTPIIVGGTGLYIDAVMFQDFTFGEPKGSLNYNVATIFDFENNKTPPNPGSRVGAREDGKRDDRNICWLGLFAPREYLVDRIGARSESNRDKVITEIRSLMDKRVPRDWLHSLGLEYRHGIELLEGIITESEYTELITTKTWQYARRQMTWFRRNPRIQWQDTSLHPPTSQTRFGI